MKGQVYILMLFSFIFIFSCTAKKENTNLVQPEKWWQVHPRPVYATLEKTDIFQDWFHVYKLNEETFAIYEPNQFEEAISYLVLGKKRGILLDTGNGIGDIKKVVQELTDLPVSVLLTHVPYDHVAGAYRFKKIAMFDNSAALQVLKKGRDNTSLQKYLTEEYLWKPLPANFDPATWTIPPMEVTELLHEGDIVDLGERQLEVIYTPGHSPGHICLLDRDNRILFTGDHFFPGPLYAFGDDVNIQDYIVSNKKLSRRIAEFDFLCSGHNDPWVKSEVILRVDVAFQTIFDGKGKFAENEEGLRRYNFAGFDVLIRADMIRD